MTTKHSQDCPIYNGRECDCNYREPVASAGNALSYALTAAANYIDTLGGDSKSYRAALASQSTPVAPVVEQARDEQITNLIAQIRAAKTMAMRDSLFETIISVWDAALAQSTPHVPAGEPSSAENDALDDCYFAAMDAWDNVLPTYLRGFSEWTIRFDAARKAFDTHRATTEGATPRAPEPAAPVAQEPTYSSTQATNCAGCGEHKHTPLRVDAMGGYVCLTCIDRQLEEFFDAAPTAAPVAQEPVVWLVEGSGNAIVIRHSANFPGVFAGDEFVKTPLYAAPTAAQGQAVDKDSLTAEAAPAGEVASELQSTAPTRIYLDIGDQFALEGILAGTTDWQVEGVTWSEDNATSHGVAYVREDLATPATEPAAPGYVSVPVEPTSKAIVLMAGAILGQRVGTADTRHPYWPNAVKQAELAYSAMLAAASTVQGKEKP